MSAWIEMDAKRTRVLWLLHEFVGNQIKTIEIYIGIMCVDQFQSENFDYEFPLLFWLFFLFIHMCVCVCAGYVVRGARTSLSVFTQFLSKYTFISFPSRILSYSCKLIYWTDSAGYKICALITRYDRTFAPHSQNAFHSNFTSIGCECAHTVEYFYFLFILYILIDTQFTDNYINAAIEWQRKEQKPNYKWYPEFLTVPSFGMGSQLHIECEQMTLNRIGWKEATKCKRRTEVYRRKGAYSTLVSACVCVCGVCFNTVISIL